jgi:hypothetical protein
MVLPHTWLLCVLELLKVIYRLVHFTFFLKACSRFSFCCTFHWNVDAYLFFELPILVCARFLW